MNNDKNYIIKMCPDNKYNTGGLQKYKDSKCEIYYDICDYRDPGWWITIVKIKLSKSQKIELLKRISANSDMKEVYEESIGIIKENIVNIDGSKSILDY